MKRSLQIFTVIFIGFMSPAFASDFTPFITIDQAQQYCPMASRLTFTPNNPSIPNSAGSVEGNNRIVFESINPKSAIHPKNMDGSGLITDAQFRSVNGMYGYISGNSVTCLYSYIGFTNVSYGLVMRGR